MQVQHTDNPLRAIGCTAWVVHNATHTEPPATHPVLCLGLGCLKGACQDGNLDIRQLLGHLWVAEVLVNHNALNQPGVLHGTPDLALNLLHHRGKGTQHITESTVGTPHPAMLLSSLANTPGCLPPLLEAWPGEPQARSAACMYGVVAAAARRQMGMGCPCSAASLQQPAALVLAG